MTLVVPRRGFLVGLGATLVAAPAVVRDSTILMPVRTPITMRPPRRRSHPVWIVTGVEWSTAPGFARAARVRLQEMLVVEPAHLSVDAVIERSDMIRAAVMCPHLSSLGILAQDGEMILDWERRPATAELDLPPDVALRLAPGALVELG